MGTANSNRCKASPPRTDSTACHSFALSCTFTTLNILRTRSPDTEAIRSGFSREEALSMVEIEGSVQHRLFRGGQDGCQRHVHRCPFLTT